MTLILKGRARLKGSTVIKQLPYSVGEFVAELVADFKGEYYRKSFEPTNFSGLITHTRASTATYVDATGTLQTAATNEPRLGHHVWNGTAWVNEGLLHESEARTNLLTYSEANTTDWVSDGATLTGLTGDYLGIFDGVQVASNGGTANRIRTFSSSVTTAQHTVRFLFIAGTSGRYAGVIFGSGVSAVVSGAIGSQPTVSSVSGLTVNSSSVVVVSSEVYALDVTFTLTSAVAVNFGIGPNTATVGETIIALGAQLEVGPTPSSYIPTAGSTVTRAADVLTIPAANLPYNSTALSIQMDGRLTYADTGTLTIGAFLRWFSSSTSQIRTDLNSIGTNTGLITFVQIDGANVDTVSTGANALSPSVLASFNIASRHGSTFLNGATDGTALTANTTPVALPDLSTTNLQLGFAYNGTIRTFRMWGQDIGDTGLVEATT
jgi:hypothetical protein